MGGPSSEHGGTEPWLHPGETLDGKFRIGELLGRGGMGVVVAAHHLDLDEAVALKFILPGDDLDGGTTATERLLREARAVAKLRSRHVTRIFDVGRTPDQLPYIVMERLHGEDLSSLLRTRGPFPVAAAVDYMLQVCEPLEEAHAQGITHRDLKPQNVFLARQPEGGSIVKLLDFGISRASSNENELTRANEFLGTPHFMSPEQFKDPRAVEPRSDIYSLGACLYSILTGRPPFFGGDLLALCKRVLGEAHQPIRELRAEVPVGLAKVIDRCLAKSPADRFPSARALRDALAPFAVGDAPKRTAHLGDETIVAMQEHRLDHEALRSVDAHVAECEECRMLLAVASPSKVEDAMASTLDAPVAPAGPAFVASPTLVSGERPSNRQMPASGTFAATEIRAASSPLSTTPTRSPWIVVAVAAVAAALFAGGLLARRETSPTPAAPLAVVTATELSAPPPPATAAKVSEPLPSAPLFVATPTPTPSSRPAVRPAKRPVSSAPAIAPGPGPIPNER